MNKINWNIKRGILPIIHILFCGIILLLPLLVMSRNGTMDFRHYSAYLIRTGVLMIVFYSNYLFLIDRFLFKKQFISYAIINTLLVIGLILLQNVLFNTAIQPPPPEIRSLGISRPPREMRLLGDYVLIVLVIGMGVAVKATIRWHRDSINLETVKAAQLEADLKNLRNQLNPHFLFNTLNNIYSLIAIDTQKAQESVYMLSGLLRYVSYENDQKFVPLDKELEFTRNYIKLMSLRLSPNVKLDMLIQGEGCKNQIASLIFITLIENAFKHGISSNKDCFIDIKILVENKKGVLCSVKNSIGDSIDTLESENKGIGLSNLKKRLELLYPDNYQLEVKQTEKSFEVMLRMDFNNDKRIEE